MPGQASAPAQGRAPSTSTTAPPPSRLGSSAVANNGVSAAVPRRVTTLQKKSGVPHEFMPRAGAAAGIASLTRATLSIAIPTSVPGASLTPAPRAATRSSSQGPGPSPLSWGSNGAGVPAPARPAPLGAPGASATAALPLATLHAALPTRPAQVTGQ